MFVSKYFAGLIILLLTITGHIVLGWQRQWRCMTCHVTWHVTHYTWRTQLRTDGELPLDFDISAKTKTGGHLPGKYQSFLAWRKSLLRGLQSLQLPSLDSWQRMQIDSKPVIPLVIILIRPGLSNSKHRVSLHYWAVRRINHRINTEKRVRS